MPTTQSSLIKTKKVTQSRISEIDFNNLNFGKVFSDHMFIADYKNGEWVDAEIMPYGQVQMSPATSALHYGQSIFEGMKAYKNDKGEVLLFRPFENYKRINISADRMAMPTIPQEIFMEGLKQLVKLDSQWVPTTEGASLYIRPFLVGTDEYIGVKPSDEYRFYIITAPGGAYYTEPVKVLVETNFK